MRRIESGAVWQTAFFRWKPEAREMRSEAFQKNETNKCKQVYHTSTKEHDVTYAKKICVTVLLLNKPYAPYIH